MKTPEIQKLAIREPRQERARHKVELILEAATRLLDKGGLPLLTTNVVAETAGVSIGTLYQYFPNKDAILDALTDREMALLSERILVVLQDRTIASPRERIGRIMRAVTSSYGTRPRVHRLMIERSLSQGGGRLSPLIDRVLALLTAQNRPANPVPMNDAEAFVLTNAVTGVLRAMILRPEGSGPPRDQIEEALGRLMVSLRSARHETSAGRRARHSVAFS